VINILKNLYDNSPLIIKSSINLLPFSRRLGKQYTYTRNFLIESRNWTLEQWRIYQFDKLKRLLFHAYNNVPYYRKKYKLAGFHPEEFTDLEQFSHLPTIDKNTIREYGDELITDNALLWKCYKQNSGGSSGKPISFWLDPESSFREWGFLIDMWKRVGFRENDRFVTLRGHNIKNNVYSYNPFFNELIYSSYRLYENRFGDYLKAYLKFNPLFIRGYPSALAQLAHLNSINGTPIKFKAALCGSEALLPHQLELIEQSFSCKCYHWYGHTERVVLSSWGKNDQSFYCYPNYGITELIDDNGVILKDDNKTGEIVGTGLYNYVMPLIRYRTADYSMWANEKRPSEFPGYLKLGKIMGRIGEFVQTIDGNKIPLTAAIYGQHLEIFENVVSLQIHQPKPGFMNILFVPTENNINMELLRKTKKRIEDISQNKLRISLFRTESPIITKSGKSTLLIDRMPEKTLKIL